MTTLPSFETLNADFDMLTEVDTGIIAQSLYYEICRVEYRGKVYFTLRMDKLDPEHYVNDLWDFSKNNLKTADPVAHLSFATINDALFQLDQRRWTELVSANLHQ